MHDDAGDDKAEHEQEAEAEQEHRRVAREHDDLEHGRLALASHDDSVLPARHVRDLGGQQTVRTGLSERHRRGRRVERLEHDRPRRRCRNGDLLADGSGAGAERDREQKKGDRFQTVDEGIPLFEATKGELMGHQTVQQAMTSNPTAITPDTPARDAARTMQSEDTGVLPIAEGGRLVGVITDRDLALRILADDRDPGTSVGELASKELVTVDPQQSLEEAARLMAEHQVRRLPVVEEDGRLVGILAQKDLAEAGHDTLTGDVVEKISQ